MVESCPKLQEIEVFGKLDACPPLLRRQIITSGIDDLHRFQGIEEVFKDLRGAKHLAVVEVDLICNLDSPFRYPPDVLEEERDAWKSGFIDVLKNSPAKDRKFLRWRTAHTRSSPKIYDVVENGELEVFAKTSL